MTASKAHEVHIYYAMRSARRTWKNKHCRYFSVRQHWQSVRQFFNLCWIGKSFFHLRLTLIAIWLRCLLSTAAGILVRQTQNTNLTEYVLTSDHVLKKDGSKNLTL